MSDLKIFETLFYPHDEGEEKVEVIIQENSLGNSKVNCQSLRCRQICNHKALTEYF